MSQNNQSFAPTINGWSEWSKYVLNTLKDQDEDLKQLTKEIHQLRISVEVLKNEMKIKSGIWGMLGGLIPVLIGLGIWALKTF